MVRLPFQDRAEAGQALAAALDEYADRDDVIVLALPRGGVPVGHEVARKLDVPLDLMLVRKLGVPGHEELAMGAIASGGARVLNDDVIQQLHIDQQALEKVIDKEQQELDRRGHAYRGDRPSPTLGDRCVILIDDGLATGATMAAAVEAVRQQSPARIVVAVPVAPPDTCYRLQQIADQVIALATPQLFGGVGQWYQDFKQTTDDEVRQLLDESHSRASRQDDQLA